ncbi:TPA: hypothetical protein DIU27_02115 [Candidatus Collierbacteria bacterium]|uniref:Prepilin-type N-terminal cleavage/methylation domain-containing protein n=1 Tax=Candidatus Collierbacteria bacterium GW2011_GWB2_44_22 TaxID=1618387 RepID=A0A0G1HXY6_9BACT|nr:MAG: hypothetical protein UW31_C0009G0021 [Candidatus Collierbacteria bacterium GW2011_GWA2_44_13]KKT51541.1 MAG: hypothetical protein UW42_C0001G0016 [Candidatus Collierbacteria bacterium GW2011_GWB1_44_197]KKT52006.1 MAG: hypothetical protein UW44_C0005G0048 [Candidatus Collierbacteria bacterium GW2011_GWB2_44_22]KKT62136.1 MAG: hypothetical protein UW56_C0011G0021 [Candidatus Collierbacteria bacterium GW2011_GWD1_44_27]KKT66706.1 MAG: hypothetical protein UW58_C0004G0055 [Candidatus Colli
MKGYTLIEVIISLLLITIILLGGTALFYQNLKSSGLSDVDLGLTSSLRSILSIIEKDIRFGQVTSVGNGFRIDCVSAGSVGYSGNSLIVNDLVGLETIYNLDNGQIASISSQTGNKEFISPMEIDVSRLSFTWFCQGSVNDKIKVEIDARNEVLGSGIGVTRSVSTEINMLNSGIN